MNDLGINSNMYSTIKSFSEITGDFLFNLRNEGERSIWKNTKDLNKLISLLKKLQNYKEEEPKFQVIYVLLNRYFRHRSKNLNETIYKIIKCLEQQKIDLNTRRDIEFVHLVLKKEYLRALSRMRI